MAQAGCGAASTMLELSGTVTVARLQELPSARVGTCGLRQGSSIARPPTAWAGASATLSCGTKPRSQRVHSLRPLPDVRNKAIQPSLP